MKERGLSSGTRAADEWRKAARHLGELGHVAKADKEGRCNKLRAREMVFLLNGELDKPRLASPRWLNATHVFIALAFGNKKNGSPRLPRKHF